MLLKISVLSPDANVATDFLKSIFSYIFSKGLLPCHFKHLQTNITPNQKPDLPITVNQDVQQNKEVMA